MAAMNRREFVQAGAATLAAGALARPALAKAAIAPTATKLKVDTYSRHLQWLRSADEVAEAAVEMGFDGVDLTVRPYPGHVDPEKVETDLPPFVNAIRKHGLQVVTITSPITDAASPNVEKILGTASQLGITHYWWGTFRYDQTKPVMPQLDALKSRVEGISKLGERYKMKAMYHTYSGSAMVGAAIWDLLSVLKNFDPAYVGFHYDVGHMTNAGGNGTWELNLRAAGPYIAGVSAKDSIFELNLASPQGGAFTGTPEQLNSRSFGPPPGAGPVGAGGASPGAGAGAPGARNPAPGGASGARASAGPGGPPTGAPGGRGPGGPGGAASGRGGGGQPNPWRVRQVPLGEGMDNLPALAAILKEIAFDGPIEVQAEYPNGGAESAQDKITLPRAMVLGAMKRDRLALKAAFTESGLL
jgi:sugar phosphate isomerase/epimerase